MSMDDPAGIVPPLRLQITSRASPSGHSEQANSTHHVRMSEVWNARHLRKKVAFDDLKVFLSLNRTMR